MYYTTTVPNISIESVHGDIYLVKSIVRTLFHNKIDFVVDFVDGQCEISVLGKNKKILDKIVDSLRTSQ